MGNGFANDATGTPSVVEVLVALASVAVDGACVELTTDEVVDYDVAITAGALGEWKMPLSCRQHQPFRSGR